MLPLRIGPGNMGLEDTFWSGIWFQDERDGVGLHITGVGRNQQAERVGADQRVKRFKIVFNEVVRLVPGFPYSIVAPKPVISPMNSGKLVAIIVASSTVTGFSAAKPITRNAMAIR